MVLDEEGHVFQIHSFPPEMGLRIHRQAYPVTLLIPNSAPECPPAVSSAQ